MDKLKIVIFLVAAFSISTNAQGGFYWRDYTGEIPADAFPGGVDFNGEPIYIGQALHPTHWRLPGTIVPSTKKLYYEYGSKEYSTYKDILILCALHHGSFKWARAKRGMVVDSLLYHNQTLPDSIREFVEAREMDPSCAKDLIEGSMMVPAGSDHDRPLLVGRVNDDNKAVIGKVVVVKDRFGGMCVTSNGTSWCQATYEVLVYNPIHSGFIQEEEIESDIIVNIYK